MREKLTVAFAAAIMAVALSFSVVTAAPAGQWHRLNPGELNEHERLTCMETPGAWHCRYDKVVEQLPGFKWDSTTGVFSGRDVTSTWSCPEWFPSSICDNVVAVYEGPAMYNTFDGKPFHVLADYVVTDINGQAILYQSWVGIFVCPWFRTWGEALAADPSCVFAS